MDLDLHRLELLYERLRKQSPARERQLLGSLGELVQHLPSLVVAGGDDGRFVVVDGYKRVRALRRLGQDLVRATLWDVSEVEALLRHERADLLEPFTHALADVQAFGERPSKAHCKEEMKDARPEHADCHPEAA